MTTLSLHCSGISLLASPGRIRCALLRIDETFPPWNPAGDQFEFQLSICDDDDDGTCLVLGGQENTLYGWSGVVAVGSDRVTIDFDQPVDFSGASVDAVEVILDESMMHPTIRDFFASVCRPPVRFTIAD